MARATFALVNLTGVTVGRYCAKDAPGALKRGGAPKPEKPAKPEK